MIVDISYDRHLTSVSYQLLNSHKQIKYLWGLCSLLEEGVMAEDFHPQYVGMVAGVIGGIILLLGLVGVVLIIS